MTVRGGNSGYEYLTLSGYWKSCSNWRGLAYILGISQSRRRPQENDIKLTALKARNVSCHQVFCGPLLLALICITVQPWDPLPEPQAPSVSCCHHLQDRQHFWGVPCIPRLWERHHFSVCSLLSQDTQLKHFSPFLGLLSTLKLTSWHWDQGACQEGTAGAQRFPKGPPWETRTLSELHTATSLDYFWIPIKPLCPSLHQNLCFALTGSFFFPSLQCRKKWQNEFATEAISAGILSKIIQHSMGQEPCSGRCLPKDLLWAFQLNYENCRRAFFFFVFGCINFQVFC